MMKKIFLKMFPLILLVYPFASIAVTLEGKVDSSFIPQDEKVRLVLYPKGKNLAIKKVALRQNRCQRSYMIGGLQPGNYRLQLESGYGDKTYYKAKIELGSSRQRHDLMPKRILRVGSTRELKNPSDAARIARKGDVIEIDAGEYRGDATAWYADNIVIRGVGGRAHIIADGAESQGKGVWVIAGKNVKVENIEISGARVSDNNGAGIRQEGRNLTLCNAYLHDNQNGLLGGGGTVLIEYSEFARNGYGKGLTHNIYIVNTDKFILRYSYSHHAKIGHNVKSRAGINYIQFNRIMDERSGTSSYAIDIPEGGHAYLVGNVVQQGVNTDNSTMISYGAEVGSTRGGTLVLVHNTLVNSRHAGTFVFAKSGVKAKLVNNLFVGRGTLMSGDAEAQNNLQNGESGFVAAGKFDYRLTAGSKARNAAKQLKDTDLSRWVPKFSYWHRASRARRVQVNKPDVGAYEYMGVVKH